MIEKIKQKLKTILFWTPVLILILLCLKMGIIAPIVEQNFVGIHFNYGLIIANDLQIVED